MVGKSHFTVHRLNKELPCTSLWLRSTLNRTRSTNLSKFFAPITGAVEEPGNLRFDVLQDEHIPTRFYIYEAYRDEQAVAAHKQTPHLQCVEKLEALMTGPRKKTTFIGLMPE